jgi:hypothetical protein
VIRKSKGISRDVRGVIVCAAILICASPMADAANIYDFGIYAVNQVVIGGSTTVGSPSQPVLVGAGNMIVGVGDATLAGGSTLYGDLRAGDDVQLNNNVTVSGTITNPGSFSAGSGTTYAAHIVAMPDLPTLPSASVFSHGVTSQSVANGGTLNLAPGSWNDITFGGGGTLNLTAGDYYLNSLIAGNSLTINVNFGVGGDLRIFVTDAFSVGGTLAMNLTGTGSYENVFVETHHVGLNAFRIGGGGGTNWSGNVFTPNGDIHLGSGSSQGFVEGYLWAGGTVDLEHGLDVQPPVPEPTSIALLATGLAALVAVRRFRRGR